MIGVSCERNATLTRMKASQAVKFGLLDVGGILKHVLKVSGVSLPALKVFIGTREPADCP